MDGLSSNTTADRRHSSKSDSSIACCCGRPDCALLKKNCTVLETVEKDVKTAAHLGQALLVRHEAYMADAERDRLDLTGRIERLEKDKTDLENENANKIEENRQLLDQLELLNNTVSESDTKIRSLEASLLSSQQAVRRLEAAAARAEDAERHIAMLEDEQTQLHSEIRITKEDARSHSQRCKEAQRGILDVQDQLERMEKEAKEERERHVEVIGRMERQREVEKQLDTAAGRLKGAAASKSMTAQKNGSSVVNHFVRDLLQDNANLQLGIAELRELLMNSNDEIESLREQLEYHQPIQEESAQSTLKAELEPHQEAGTRLSQELHIHHHYHVAKQEVRKPKKKRQGLTPGVFCPPISTATAQVGMASSSAEPANLSQPEREKTATAPPPNWAPFSNPPSEFASSVPSSPRSNRVSSVFDNSMFGDNGPPTSPTTSFDPMSPTWRAHRKRPSAASYQSMQSIQGLPQLDIPEPEGQGQRAYFDDIIHEEDEEAHNGDDDAPSLSNNDDPSLEDSNEDSEFSINEPLPQPRLHRAMSHESIMSLTGGLDIHTLKSRPSQMTLRPIGGPGVEAVMTSVTAQPTLSRASTKRSDVALRDHFAGYQNLRSASGPMAGSPRSISPASRHSSQNSGQGAITGGLGKLVGWRPWGGSNTNTETTNNDSLTPEAAINRAVSPAPSSRPRQTPKPKSSYQGLNRTTGINQAGSIPGFQQYWASQRRKGAPAKVTAETINHDILSESLRE